MSLFTIEPKQPGIRRTVRSTSSFKERSRQCPRPITTGPSPPPWRSQRGYFELERGRYGPVFPRTPACYGFSIIAQVKEGREDAIREHGKTIQAAITETPEFLAPLRLHYLRWVLFDIGDGLTFQYQGIFDTDFDKYTEDAVQLFGQSGINTVFTNLEGFPEDWKENPDSFVKFVREHHFPSFLEYGEYPYVTADEVKKALTLKAAFSTMLDQMQ